MRLSTNTAQRHAGCAVWGRLSTIWDQKVPGSNPGAPIDRNGPARSQRRPVCIAADLPYFDFVESFGAVDDPRPARRISLFAASCALSASFALRPRLCNVFPMLLPDFKPSRIASVVMLGFVAPRSCARTLAWMNWPRVSLRFAPTAVL